MKIKLFNTRIALYIFYAYAGVFFIIPNPAYSLSIPEGIRGFAVTYGAWIESVLSKSPLRDILFPDDQEQFRKFEKLLITSERLADEGISKEALSYLRRADFFLQDIEKSLSRKYGWNKPSYTIAEINIWTPNAKEAWTISKFYQINLQLQYEYYYMLDETPSAENYAYLHKALQIYQSMIKDTNTYRELQNSPLVTYMNLLEESWNTSLNDNKFSMDTMIDYIYLHSEDLMNVKGFWQRKFMKRSVLLLAKYGHPEKAWYLLNRLNMDNADVLPVKINYYMMIYNTRFQEAKKFITDNIGILDVSDMDNWGIYITYEKYYLNLLLMLKDYDAYYSNMDKFIAQLKIFSQRMDLTTDIFEYLDFELNDASLNKNIIQSILNPQNNSNTKAVSIPRNGYIPGDLQDKYEVTESYKNENRNIKSSTIYSLYRNFQISLNKHKYQEANSILLRIQNDNADPHIVNLARLKNALFNKDTTTSTNNWYSLWITAIYSYFTNPDIITAISSGVLINFNFENEFFKFIFQNPDVFSSNDLLNLLNAISLANGWNEKMLYPPDYYGYSDFKIRYSYLSKWGFTLSDNEKPSRESIFSLESLKKTTTCSKDDICWIVYPGKNTLYSFLIQDSKIVSMIQLANLNENLDLISGFYKKMKSGISTKESLNMILKISEKFSAISGQILNTVNSGATIRLLTYNYAHFLPIESLIVNVDSSIFLGDKYKIIRRLPVDQPFSITQKKEKKQAINIQENLSDHFFIGVGNISPGFIIANPEVDELLDLEGLFAKKKLISDSTDASSKIIRAIEENQTSIIHISGGWNTINNQPFLSIGNNNAIPWNSFRYIENINYFVLSKNSDNNFNSQNYMSWDTILTSLRYKNIECFITSMAPAPKEFRQAFFYDFYYKTGHRKNDWPGSFFSSIDRTKKGFPDSIWPHLMVIYEK
ncbi:MAG: hypothetical protein OEV66_11010 [Spirochaetia bacterium]|nr:hypothetical protein [Spirochaetia bacterium]